MPEDTVVTIDEQTVITPPKRVRKPKAKLGPKPAVAKKTAPKAQAKAKAAPKAKAKVARGPKVGICETILAALQRAEGATASEILSVLTKKYKDREPAKMANTIRGEIKRLPQRYNFEMKRLQKEGRAGIVYKAPARLKA